MGPKDVVLLNEMLSVAVVVLRGTASAVPMRYAIKARKKMPYFIVTFVLFLMLLV